jgi:hypothetical protein
MSKRRNTTPKEGLLIVISTALIFVGIFAIVIIETMPASLVTEMSYHVFGRYTYMFNQSNSWFPWSVVFIAGIIVAMVYRKTASSQENKEEEEKAKRQKYIEEQALDNEKENSTRIADPSAVSSFSTSFAGPSYPYHRNNEQSFKPDFKPNYEQSDWYPSEAFIEKKKKEDSMQDAVKLAIVEALKRGKVKISAKGKISQDDVSLDEFSWEIATEEEEKQKPEPKVILQTPPPTPAPALAPKPYERPQPAFFRRKEPVKEPEPEPEPEPEKEEEPEPEDEGEEEVVPPVASLPNTRPRPPPEIPIQSERKPIKKPIDDLLAPEGDQ